jgi:hypothetical protein
MISPSERARATSATAACAERTAATATATWAHERVVVSRGPRGWEKETRGGDDGWWEVRFRFLHLRVIF